MVTLGVISDIHIGPHAFVGGKLRKLTHLAEQLTTSFAERMRDEVKPDLLVNLGDCIQDASAAEDLANYQRCLGLLAAAERELIHVAGNHDLINLDAAALRGCWGMSADGRLYDSFDRGGFHFVVLHTHERHKIDVTIDAEQLSWLEADLAATSLPTVVLMHHSAADQDLSGNRWFEGLPQRCLVEQRRELRQLLAKQGRTIVVLNGHLHWNHLDVIDGIPYVTLQSLIENVEEDAPGTPAAAHMVVRLTPEQINIDVCGAQPARYQFHPALR